MNHVYFPTTAIVSLLYVIENGASAEIAVVGNEGIVGIALFMGGETHPITHNLPGAGIRGTASLQCDGKCSNLLHAFPNGLGTGVAVVFAAEKPTEAGNQAHHYV